MTSEHLPRIGGQILIFLPTATTMFREMDMRFWREKAEAELKELR